MIQQPTAGVPRWEHFPHDADVGVRGIGASKADALAQAALAMTAAVTDPALVEPREAVTISIDRSDDGMLLYDWLNAIVYEMAIRAMLFSRFEIDIHPSGLRAAVWGEPVDVARHQPAAEVKGATFTGLRLERDTNCDWVAQCVVDV